jgi:hypothetical protein
MSRPLALAATRSAAFDVRADRDPNVACRVLGHFAQLGLTPSRVQISTFDDELRLRVLQPDLGEHAAEVIAEKLRALVRVRAVRLEHQLGPSALAAA